MQYLTGILVFVVELVLKWSVVRLVLVVFLLVVGIGGCRCLFVIFGRVGRSMEFVGVRYTVVGQTEDKVVMWT